MKTIEGSVKCTEAHQELQRQYRIALGIWSEAKALYPANSPEVERAGEHVGIIEYQLTELYIRPVEPLVPAMESLG